MKKTIYTVVIALFSIGMLTAQQKLTLDFSNKSAQQRKEMIRTLTPEQRRELYRSYRENALIEELKVKEESQNDFKRVYSEYQSSQRKIKDQFDNGYDPDALSDSEAKVKLEESFDYGQKLIENRREYSRKMQQVIRPQQVIKLFRAEGQMRDRMLNHRMELRENSAPNAGSQNSNSTGFSRSAPGMRSESGSATLRTPARVNSQSGAR